MIDSRIFLSSSSYPDSCSIAYSVNPLHSNILLSLLFESLDGLDKN